MNNERCKKVSILLEKGLLVNLYIFALGFSFSKAATSISGGLIILFWLTKLIMTRNFKVQISSVGLPFLIFIGGILISGFDAWNSRTLDKTAKFFLLALFYFAVINSDIDLKTVKRLSYVALTSMILASLNGFYEHYFLDVSRLSKPLAFGCILGVAMMFTLSFSLWGRINKKFKIILLLSTVFFAVNLLFTISRGAWLGFIGGASVLFWLKNKKLIIVFTAFLLGLSLVLPPVYVERFHSSFDTKNNTSNLTRLGLWKGSLLMFRDHPINGVGINNFSQMYETKYRQRNSGTSVHAHNNILHYMAETGIIGLISFLWLMLAALRLLYRSYKSNPNPNWQLYFLASFCGLIIFNIQGLTENNFGDTETIRFFWFLLGLNVAVSNQFQPTPIRLQEDSKNSSQSITSTKISHSTNEIDKLFS